MNKKLITLLMLGLCLAATNVWAAQDYQNRNIFNKFTDWSATIGKSSEQKQEIIDQRVEARAEKRQAIDEYNQKKRELNKDYKDELLYISNQNDTPEEMAKRLKDASQNHKNKLNELQREKLHN